MSGGGCKMSLTTYQGTVTGGRILLPSSVTLPDGAIVLVTVLDEWTPTADDVQEAKLLGQVPEFYHRVERALKEVRDGETIPFEEMMDGLSD
jgi:hypothetical protein